MHEHENQEHPELAAFGEELRREREIRGISLKEIADATKVSRRFLEAIERNDHRTLPAPVFTRGFVREYARYLGLNAEDIVNRYNSAASGDDRIEQSDHLVRLSQAVAEREPGSTQRVPPPRRGIPPPYSHVDRNVVVLVFIVAALAGVIYWAVNRKHPTQIDEAVARPPVSAPVPRTPRIAQRAPAAAATTTTASAAPDDSLLHLVIDATENSWVTLEVDGKRVLSDEIRKGERRTYDAHDTFVFQTIGNAGGLDLTLNGVRLPSFGGPGVVVHQRVLDRETLQETAVSRGGAERTGT